MRHCKSAGAQHLDVQKGNELPCAEAISFSSFRGKQFLRPMAGSPARSSRRCSSLVHAQEQGISTAPGACGRSCFREVVLGSAHQLSWRPPVAAYVQDVADEPAAKERPQEDRLSGRAIANHALRSSRDSRLLRSRHPSCVDRSRVRGCRPAFRPNVVSTGVHHAGRFRCGCPGRHCVRVHLTQHRRGSPNEHRLSGHPGRR